MFIVPIEWKKKQQNETHNIVLCKIEYFVDKRYVSVWLFDYCVCFIDMHTLTEKYVHIYTKVLLVCVCDDVFVILVLN